jgi:AcrR family transcriptional regulator
MGRTPTGAKEKLIKTGEILARQKGISGFSVRELCLKSKVNLGIFHYYFGTKDKFDQIVMKNFYSGMLEKINATIKEDAPPKVNIRAVVLAIYDFVSQNKVMLSALAGDVFSGKKNIIKFIANDFTRHVTILYREFEKADKNKQLTIPNPLAAMQIIVAPFVLPNLLLGLAERVDDSVLNKFKAHLLNFKFDLDSTRRVDAALNLLFKGNK